MDWQARAAEFAQAGAAISKERDELRDKCRVLLLERNNAAAIATEWAEKNDALAARLKDATDALDQIANARDLDDARAVAKVALVLVGPAVNESGERNG